MHIMRVTYPPAKTSATKILPMASGAKSAAVAIETWIVKTKAAVPINSVANLSLMAPAIVYEHRRGSL